MTTSYTNFALNIPDSGRPRVVIAGGGFGGINTAKKLRKKGFQVVLLDRYNYHTFQPLLYQVATAGLEPDSIAGPFRKFLESEDDFHFRMMRVTGFDYKAQLVFTPIGSLHYDYLVIATGAKTNYFGNEDIMKNSFPIKQVPHALDLRSHIFQQFEKAVISSDPEEEKALLNFVVVGAGPTGVEISGALSELKLHIIPHDYPDIDAKSINIYLVEGLDRVLPAMSEKSGNRAHRYLEKLGVMLS